MGLRRHIILMCALACAYARGEGLDRDAFVLWGWVIVWLANLPIDVLQVVYCMVLVG